MSTSGAPGIRPVRRVVAGPDPSGAPAIMFDGASPHVATLPGMPETLGLTDVWASREMPPANAPSADDAVPGTFAVAPGADGTLFRVVQFPPAGEDQPGPLWHRTDTLDYNVVVEGEVWLLTEGGEARLGPGDCAVVRGISHAWENRSDALCLLAAVAIAARPA